MSRLGVVAEQDGCQAGVSYLNGSNIIEHRQVAEIVHELWLLFRLCSGRLLALQSALWSCGQVKQPTLEWASPPSAAGVRMPGPSFPFRMTAPGHMEGQVAASKGAGCQSTSMNPESRRSSWGAHFLRVLVGVLEALVLWLAAVLGEVVLSRCPEVILEVTTGGGARGNVEAGAGCRAASVPDSSVW